MQSWLAVLWLTGVVTASDDRPRTEIGIVPLVGGDTDIGVGVGFLGSVARVAPSVRPYLWRVESAAFVSFKRREGSFEVPYQDVFVAATFPRLAGGRVRLEVRPSYSRETNLRYYGIGNATPAPERDLRQRDFYERTHPTLGARLRLEAGNGLHALAGTSHTYNAIDFAPESRLARDAASQDSQLRSLLRVDRRFFVHLVEVGLGFDRRDDEIAPAWGQHHTLTTRVSPSGFFDQPFEYWQLTLIARWYMPLWPGRLVLAARQVADGLFGDPPFYELGRFGENTSAIGGPNGVRGVPSDRYLGKLKLFGNVELRGTVVRFSFLASEYLLGAVAFVDAGRVWADVGSTPSLDGRGLGLKGAVGGGLRVQKGRTFVVRADVAWSPDARPIGAYFLAGHIF